jgi:choline dehydrogenase
MRPNSLGRVTIRSVDAVTHASICFNYLADTQDRKDLHAVVRLTREILEQPDLSPYRGEELNPGSAIQSDEDSILEPGERASARASSLSEYSRS